MYDNTDPLYFKRRPELFKKQSADLAKEVSLRVRFHKTSEGYQQEVLNKCVDEPVDKLFRPLVDELWQNYRLTDKAMELATFADAEASRAPAWRPMTGETELDPLYMKGLMYRKNKLERKMADQAKLISDLEAELINKRKQLDEQMIAMVKAMNES